MEIRRLEGMDDGNAIASDTFASSVYFGDGLPNCNTLSDANPLKKISKE